MNDGDRLRAANTGRAIRNRAKSANAQAALVRAREPAPPRASSVLRAERGQARDPEPGEKHQPVVQGEGEPGQPRGHVHDARKARAVGEAGYQEREEDRAAAHGWPRGEGQAREGKEHRARIPDGHPGSVVASLVDDALSVDAVRERQRVGKQPLGRRAQRDRLPRSIAEGLPARAVLGRMRDRLEQRKELRPAQEEGDASRGQRHSDRARHARRRAAPASSQRKYTPPAATEWKNDSGWPPQNDSQRAATVRPIAPAPGARASRRSPSSSSGNVAVEGPTLQPFQKTRYVENPQPTAPTSAARVPRPKSWKRRKPESRPRKSVNVHENVHESGTGSQIPSHVEGWKTPACAVPRRGPPASTNRFQSGSRPCARLSRTAARQGRFANARSERIGLRGRFGESVFHGSAVK